jgi:hypothetical protein
VKFDPLKILFTLSLLFLVFVYGAVTMMFKIFPYQYFNKAQISYKALKDLKKQKAAEEKTWPGEMPEPGKATKPTAVVHDGPQGDELILVSGGLGQLKSHCPKYGCVAWLTDRQGQMKHVWQYDPDIWKDLDYIKGEGDKRKIYPMGLHMFDNGDLLVSYQAHDAYPIGVGIAKFDKDSKLIWKRADFDHHWFSVADSGEIYTPAMRVVDAPLPLGNTRARMDCKQAKFAMDAITVLNADGKLLREISLYDALVNSGYVGIFRGGILSEEMNACDPIHLNDLRVVGDVVPTYPSGVKKGDIFLSMRSLNAVALLDGKTERFKWMSVGSTIQQHSPRFDGHDGLFVFDNRGGPAKQGGTRIVRIDMLSGQPQTVFPKPDVPLPEKFFSQTAGHIDLHREQPRMLVASTHQGVVWEVNVTNGEVIWEYVNTHSLRGKYARFPVYTAKYVYDTAFAFNQQGVTQ